MAKVTHWILASASGRIGDIIVRQTAAGPVAAKAPTLRKPPSFRQKAHRERFRKAIRYAMANARRPEYQDVAAKTKCSAYAMAVKDFMLAPVFRKIDLGRYSGRRRQAISACVEDVTVAEVAIEIRTSGGRQVESGSMVRHPVGGDEWTYLTTCSARRGALVVRIEATDLAGNRSVGEEKVDTRDKRDADSPPPRAPAPHVSLAAFLRLRAQAARATHDDEAIAKWRHEARRVLARFRDQLAGIEELELGECSVRRRDGEERYNMPSLTIRFLDRVITLEPSRVGQSHEVLVKCRRRLAVLIPIAHGEWEYMWRRGGKGGGRLTAQAIDAVVRGMVE